MKVLVGLSFALIVGHFFTAGFLWAVRRSIKLGPKPGESIATKRLPPWLTGVVERLIFAIFVATNTPSVAPAMIGWLALKLAANWNHPLWNQEPDARTFAMTALLAGLVSMACAFVGGLIASGKLWI